MAELKTQETESSALAFIDTIDDEEKKQDSLALIKMLSVITGKAPKMWGKSIVGFGKYKYKYESGREGEWFLCGFSPRVKAMTIYIIKGFGNYESYLEKLGKYRLGESCLYIKRLEDIDLEVLQDMIRAMVHDISENAKIVN